MASHHLKVTISEDHRLEIRLPDEFPLGPAEVTVLTEDLAAAVRRREQILADLLSLRRRKLTVEEERILDDFERFRATKVLDYASLGSAVPLT